MCLVCEVLCMCARASVAALRTAPLRRAYTCRHKATAPQATHMHVTAYAPRRAACTVVRVCTARSLRVCVHVECGRSFSRKGKRRVTSASSGAHRPRPSLREHPPRCLAHTPHAPALVPPVVDHLPCRGGVSLRSRSACAAQQGRPIPSSPEERTNCEGRKNSAVGCQFQSGPKLRVPALSAPTAAQESTRTMC